MIIFGTKGFTKDLGRTSINQLCPNCNNHVTLQAQQVGRKFSLFFIPLFTVSSKYYGLCPVCNYGYELIRNL